MGGFEGREHGHEHHDHGQDPRGGGRGRGGDDRRGRGGFGGGFPGGFPGGFGGGFPAGGFSPFDRLSSLFGRGGGPRARRGDIRAAILALLAERPFNGYQVIQELEQRSQGVWRPSPGSVYPTFQQLEDEGLIASEESGAGKGFRLTEAGQAYVRDHKDEVTAPWDAIRRAAGGDEAHQRAHELFGQLKQIATAAIQVTREGTPAQAEQARRILADAKRALYGVLAEEGAAPIPEEEDAEDDQ